MNDFNHGDVVAVLPHPTYHNGSKGWAFTKVTTPTLTTVDVRTNDGNFGVRIDGEWTLIDKDCLVLVQAAPAPKPHVNRNIVAVGKSTYGPAVTAQREASDGTLARGIFIKVEEGARYSPISVEDARTLAEGILDLLKEG